MPAADDQPTRAVPPGRPRQPVAGAGPPQPPPRTWEEELADRISALKNWLILVAILTVAATGIAIYALVQSGEDQSPADSGVTSAQFNELEDKVSDLQSSTASDSAVSQLKSDVSDLDDRVKKLESSSQGEVTPDQLDALQQQVADLAQEISALQSGQAQ